MFYFFFNFILYITAFLWCFYAILIVIPLIFKEIVKEDTKKQDDRFPELNGVANAIMLMEAVKMSRRIPAEEDLEEWIAELRLYLAFTDAWRQNRNLMWHEFKATQNKEVKK